MMNDSQSKVKRYKYYYIATGFILAVTVLYILNTFVFVNGVKADGKISDDFPQGYKITSPYIPSELDFAGENVPLTNYEVKERVDRELMVNTYWHSFTLLSIKKANRWFPVIEPILKRNNIPDDFKYLALIESGLANVISPAGATGYWQFLESTGKRKAKEKKGKERKSTKRKKRKYNFQQGSKKRVNQQSKANQFQIKSNQFNTQPQ
jgi:hypothetical protein